MKLLLEIIATLVLLYAIFCIVIFLIASWVGRKDKHLLDNMHIVD